MKLDPLADLTLLAPVCDQVAGGGQTACNRRRRSRFSCAQAFRPFRRGCHGSESLVFGHPILWCISPDQIPLHTNSELLEGM